MRKGDTYTILFATAVCVACSIALSATSSLLKARQDREVELDRRMNVLKALGVQLADAQGKRISGDEVEKIFADHITEVVLDAATGKVLPGVTSSQITPDELAHKLKLPLYIWKDGGEISKYAFPVSGKGLWSTIYGYLALDRDLSTVIGITFYRHGETPGLGGEISTDKFQAEFKGKKVFENGKLLRLEVVKGKVADKYPDGNDHAVDGISGATLTGKGLNHFINQDLENYDKYFTGIRKG